MSGPAAPSTRWRSVVAIAAGFVTTAVLSVGADVFMQATGVFPSWGEAMSGGLFAWATAYRVVFTILAGFVTSRLSPERPMWQDERRRQLSRARRPAVRCRKSAGVAENCPRFVRRSRWADAGTPLSASRRRHADCILRRVARRLAAQSGSVVGAHEDAPCLRVTLRRSISRKR